MDVGVLMVATVKVEREDGQIRMIANSLRPLDQVIGNASEGCGYLLKNRKRVQG